MSSLVVPPHNSCVRLVQSFEELASTPFTGSINALCWPRHLPGDYQEVAAHLQKTTAWPRGITTIDDEHLAALLTELHLTAAGKLAVQTMQDDLHRLRQLGLDPVLDYVNGYPGREPEILRTDVCSWHVDSATCEADTWLCTYHGRSSEGLPNESARRRVDIPETRAALLKHHGGPDDESFLEYLNDHFFDLHYLPLPGALPYLFGQASLWRIATAWPGSPVPPCIHRAPDPVAGELPRLLLIS